jgi:hypothetical protein
MVSRADTTPQPAPPKPLKGVGIIIAQEQENGSHTTLGVIFAPNKEKLERLIRSIHGQKITVNLADIRGGEITLDR